jgi:proline iminopeptidase
VPVTERAVTTDDGVRLWTAEEGSGPTLVLCHGGPGLWDYLAPVSSMLRDVVRVVRWDQRGCGRSSAASAHSVRRYIEDLETIREAFGVQHWIVGGHSWGATLALQYALSYPERTLALIYISGTGIGQAWNRAYHLEADRRRTPFERARLSRLANQPRTPSEEAEYRLIKWLPDLATRQSAAEVLAQLDEPFEINVDANRHINVETRTWREADLAARCDVVTAPTLLVHGACDPRPPWAIDSLGAAVRNVSVEILPGVGHLPWLEDPVVFARTLRSFLSHTTSRGRA